MLYFVVNPASSSGKGLKIWKQAEEILRQKDVPFECTLLEKPGDATQAALRLTDIPSHPADAPTHLTDTAARDTIVIVGGDGTLSEFLSGVKQTENLLFGYIPTGSANDFARAMKLMSDPAAALERILSPKTVILMDIGQTAEVKGTQSAARFAVSSGIGYDAAACYESSRTRFKSLLNRFHLGNLIYVVSALRLLMTMKPFQMQLKTDDGQVLKFSRVWFATAMNTPYEGGGFKFCPDAAADDEMLDLVIAEGLSRLKVLCMMPTALWGGHVGKKGIHLLRCRRAAVKTDQPACVHTDGEHFGFCTQITWALSKKKLPLIIE